MASTEIENDTPFKVPAAKDAMTEDLVPSNAVSGDGSTTVGEDDAFRNSILANMGPDQDVQAHSTPSDDKFSKTTDATGDAIRKQVDHYFSDENLYTDYFLCSKMKDDKNQPLPLSMVAKFSKMRRFQTSDILQALKTSSSVKIIDDKGVWHIQRKVPFSRSAHKKRVFPGAPPKRKRPKPTGFEDSFVEGPVTPAEHEEEQEIYHPDYSFAERIETAIQRYKAKRKFSPFLAEIWVRWLKYGGIQTGQKQFSGGMIEADIDSKTSAELTKLTATEFCRDDQYDLGPDGNWDVDFEDVARGFLSSYAISTYQFESSDKITQCTKLMRNFYNYLMYHNVCPEYNDQILAARKVCDMADQQLVACQSLVKRFPGHFNVSCSVAFETPFSKNFSQDHRNWEGAEGLGATKRQSLEYYSFALTLYGPYDILFYDPNIGKMSVLPQELVSWEQDGQFEVTSILPNAKPRSESWRSYNKVGLKPLGEMYCKPWTPPTFSGTDLPKDYITLERPDSYKFLVEPDILKELVVGMRWYGTVYRLSCGLWFIDNLISVQPSYYTRLYNELLFRGTKGRDNPWREPEVIPRERHLENDMVNLEATLGERESLELEDSD